MKRKNVSIDEDSVTDENEVPQSQTGSKKRKSKEADLFQEEQDETADKENMSQNPDFAIPDEAEVGIVEQVTITNFMCHKFLEVRFGANVNFVIGRNGSGKSAILTALVVGLGGKASTTNRGNSLKLFIKEGCHASTIKIRLRNRGYDAFRPDAYGKSIMIERRLSSDGTSAYRIKSDADKIVSQKKDELLAILDHFNIQIDNPVSILNQETSRSFLNTSDARDKYKFFLKATQLEQMSTDYQQAIEDKEILKQTLEKKKKVIPELLQEVKLFEEKYNDLKQLQEMKKDVKTLKEELVWAMVRDKKIAVEDAGALEEQHKSRLPKYENKINECIAKEVDLTKEWNEKNDNLESFGSEAEMLANEKQAMSLKLKEKKNYYKAKIQRRNAIERERRNVEKERNQLLQGIEDIKAANSRDLEAERQEREQQVEAKREEKKRFESQLNVSTHQYGQLEAAIKQLKERHYRIRSEVNDARKVVDRSKNRITELEASQRDKLSLYGAHTAAVHKNIEQYHKQGRFHKKPLGPIGSMISLKDPRWALAVEGCLKQNITSYCCHDHHDMKVLQEIFSRHVHGRKPTIIVSKFLDKAYDTSRARPQCNYPVVLDMIDVDNPNLINALIDTCQAETVLLIEKANVAQDVLWRNLPKNAWKAISLDGYETIGGNSSKAYPSTFQRAKYLQPSIEEALRQVERDLKDAIDRQQKLSQEFKDLEGQIRLNEKEHSNARKKCNSEQDMINRINAEIQEIESFEEEGLPDVAALEDEAETCHQKLLALTDQVQKEDTECASEKEQVAELDTLLKECHLKVQEMVEKLEPLRTELEKIEGKITEAKSHKSHYEKKKKELLVVIDEYRKQFLEIEKDFQQIREQAHLYCDEIETNSAVNDLESKIQQMEKRITREDQRRGNAEETIKNYETALKRYKETTTMIKSHSTFKKHLEKAMKRRAKRFVDFQRYIVIRARHYFQMLLSQRGYTGKLKFDHENETLVVQVNVEHARGAASKDSKSLSGGERSFSTICFIMALWEAMEAPFRCLDEFDVFMDMLNRRISMNMLMKIAKEQQQRQFILLTPQDMSTVTGGDRVRIFRLKNPERDQQTIEETMAT